MVWWNLLSSLSLIFLISRSSRQLFQRDALTTRKQKPYKAKHHPLRRIKEPLFRITEPLYGIIIPVSRINEIEQEKYGRALSPRACVASVTLLRGLVLCNRSRRDREPSRICVVNPKTWTVSCSSYEKRSNNLTIRKNHLPMRKPWTNLFWLQACYMVFWHVFANI